MPSVKKENNPRFGGMMALATFYCNVCGGIPAYCHGELYLHSDEDYQNCEKCGEQNAADNHALLGRFI
ncbi:MAG TPA: hypothetical protein QGG18_07155 [Rhodospirillales bacterium]|nr:hypothetical protein [Rhodospirillales bacterium]